MQLPSVKNAFLIHLAISLIIFIALAALMRLVWYPGDLFHIDGGIQGLKIIAPIDLVLGPALTLCFYRPWKKSLKFDMAAIALVQVAALGYGVYTVYHQRTAALVFAEHRFETLSLSEYKNASRDMRENDLTPANLSDFPGSMPVIVHAESFADYGQYLADVLNGLPELRERSDRYKPIADTRNSIAEYRVKSQSDGTSIAGSNNSTVAGKTPAIGAAAAAPDEIYPLKARYDNGTIEFDPADFQWINIKRATD